MADAEGKKSPRGAKKAAGDAGAGAGAEPAAGKPAADKLAEPAPAGRAGGGLLLPLLAISALVAAAAVYLQNSPELKESVVSLVPESAVQWVEQSTGFSLAPRTNVREIFPQDTKPANPVSFSVHFNGDGLGEGLQVTTDHFTGLDQLIRYACNQFPEVAQMAQLDTTDRNAICMPSNGARLYTDTAVRIFSFMDVRPGMRTYIVPQGVHFVWPLGKVGDLYYPEIESPVPEKPIRLRQLSMSPRVFTVENFMSPEEMSVILEHNKDRVKPSEVGFSGWRDSTRTSSTAWDFNSWAAKRVQRRAFDLLGMDFEPELADATQVLRYEIKEWYKPHTDWFDARSYDEWNPRVNNGTNRFATVFLYLTDVDAGGHTVFPLSTTHEGYNGEELVHPGTADTPGYIAQRDAEWVCNTSSTALRSEPKAGNAVLFYSQGPDGTLDEYSLHGGCPVIEGLKWSANVWIWNRPKPSREKAKDKKDQGTDNSIFMQFSNKRKEAVSLFWDDGSEQGVFQSHIMPNMLSPMNTYHGHTFFVRIKDTNTKVFTFTADEADKGKERIVEIE